MIEETYHRMVKVIWQDSASIDTWHDIDNCITSPSTVTTVGWEIVDNGEAMVIAGSVSNTEHIHSAMTIPAGSIIKVTYLRCADEETHE